MVGLILFITFETELCSRMVRISAWVSLRIGFGGGGLGVVVGGREVVGWVGWLDERENCCLEL